MSGRAILDNDDLKCWGRGSYGALGLESNVSLADAAGEMGNSLPAVSLGTDRKAVQLSSDGTSQCALLDDETIKCWGDNDNGQLGQGHVNPAGIAAGKMGDNLAVTPIQ